MLLHLTAEERRVMAAKYRQGFPEATFYEQVASQNGQPFRLDETVRFYRRAQATWEEGVIALLMSNVDEQQGPQTFVIVLFDDHQGNRRQFRVLVSEVTHSTS